MYYVDGTKVLKQNSSFILECGTTERAEERCEKLNNPIVITRPKTDITVNETKVMINTDLSFDFITELSDGTYFMPVSQQGTEQVMLKAVVVENGAGVINVNFSKSGIYFIDNSKLDTDLLVNGQDSTRFTLYVAE